MTTTLASPQPPHLRHLPISFERNLKHEARTNEEDWSGLASPAERRKIQNRLNARAYRKRKTLQKQSLRSQSASTHPESSQANQSDEDIGTIISDPSAENNQNNTERKITFNKNSSSLNYLNPDTFGDAVFKKLQQRSAHYPRLIPTADNLLTLISFNVFRAFMTNINLLCLDLSMICDDDYPSPFCQDNPSYPRARQPAFLPHSLLPTYVQRTIPHHPSTDTFPSAKFREQLILCQDLIDEDDLYQDLMGEMVQLAGDMLGDQRCQPKPRDPADATKSPQGCGMVVWGEPYLVDSWEFSEPFFRKWFWLLSGCSDLIASSNRWRARRGESPLPTRIEEVA